MCSIGYLSSTILSSGYVYATGHTTEYLTLEAQPVIIIINQRNNTVLYITVFTIIQ